jgi:hypothetical protein
MRKHFRERVSHDLISRRALLRSGVIGATVGTVPAVAAPPAPVEELPMEAFERLSAELSDLLNSYLNGRFCAKIYPSASHENPVWLTSIAADRTRVAACCAHRSD